MKFARPQIPLDRKDGGKAVNRGKECARICTLGQVLVTRAYVCSLVPAIGDVSTSSRGKKGRGPKLAKVLQVQT